MRTATLPGAIKNADVPRSALVFFTLPCAEHVRQVIHAGLTSTGQHAVEALRRDFYDRRLFPTTPGRGEQSVLAATASATHGAFDRSRRPARRFRRLYVHDRAGTLTKKVRYS